MKRSHAITHPPDIQKTIDRFWLAVDEETITSAVQTMCCLPSMAWRPIFDQFLYGPSAKATAGLDALRASVIQSHQDYLRESMAEGLSRADGVVSDIEWQPPQFTE